MPDQVLQDITAILTATLFLALGFLIVWVTKSVLKIEGDLLVVALLLMPILGYLIFSGQLEELRGPGGLGVKLKEAATASVEIATEPIEASIEAPQTLARGGDPQESLSRLQKFVEVVDESKPIVLTLTLGKGHYNKEVILQYLKELSKYRNFRFAVFLDPNDRFVAYMPAWKFRQLLETGTLGDAFLQAINAGRFQELHRYPDVMTSTVSTSATNIEALQGMTSQNLEALIVIDKNRWLRGVVERELILSKLMLAMTR